MKNYAWIGLMMMCEENAESKVIYNFVQDDVFLVQSPISYAFSNKSGKFGKGRRGNLGINHLHLTEYYKARVKNKWLPSMTKPLRKYSKSSVYEVQI